MLLGRIYVYWDGSGTVLLLAIVEIIYIIYTMMSILAVYEGVWIYLQLVQALQLKMYWNL